MLRTDTIDCSIELMAKLAEAKNLMLAANATLAGADDCNAGLEGTCFARQTWYRLACVTSNLDESAAANGTRRLRFMTRRTVTSRSLNTC